MDREPDVYEASLGFLGRSRSVWIKTQGGRDYLVELIRAGGGLDSYEKPTLALFAHLVASRPGYVLDIGANTGLFALVAATASPVAKVCAFEPLEAVFAMLEGNLAANPELRGRIAASRFGFSDQAGEQTFYETINDAGFVSTSSTLERTHAEFVGAFREHVITLQTLDEWVPTLRGPPVTVMKIDVEGHEHAVLNGGRNTLAAHRPVMFVEMLGNSRFDIINRILIEQDYADFAIAPTALRHCAAPRFFDDAWNHLLCPAEHLNLVFSHCRTLGLSIEIS